MICCRCKKEFEGFKSINYTAGYYEAIAWPQFSNPGEIIICDSCMWHDPRYIEVYGVTHV